jgi:predicted metal-dependent hydrolase
MQSEKNTLHVGSLTVRVTRKKMKNMYLRVKESGGVVEVSAPLSVRDNEIIRFVQEREAWIAGAQERIKKAELSRAEEPVLVPFAEREMRQRLRRQLAELIARWEPVMGVKSNGFTIKKMKSRWGSCNVQTHHLNFNLMLAQVPDSQVEYVVVHELTHLLEPSHSPRFWALMEHYLPGAGQLRRDLNHGKK